MSTKPQSKVPELKKSRDLRIQATVAGSNHIYTSYTKGISATIGILYNHTFHLLKK